MQLTKSKDIRIKWLGPEKGGNLASTLITYFFNLYNFYILVIIGDKRPLQTVDVNK